MTVRVCPLFIAEQLQRTLQGPPQVTRLKSPLCSVTDCALSHCMYCIISDRSTLHLTYECSIPAKLKHDGHVNAKGLDIALLAYS